MTTNLLAAEAQLVQVDELWQQFAYSTRGRTQCDILQEPLLAGLLRASGDGATQVEVVTVLHLIARLREALVLIELALLDRCLGFRGLQALVAEVLGIGVAGVTLRRKRLASAVAGHGTVKQSPRQPRPTVESARTAAERVAIRHELELEDDDSGRRCARSIPATDDHWGLLLQVWLTELAISREAAREDIVDGLRLVVYVRFQLARLEERWLQIGRNARIPNAVLGAPMGRRSRNAVWNARARLQNGNVQGGFYNLKRAESAPSAPHDARARGLSEFDEEVRVTAAALLKHRLPLQRNEEFGSWLSDLADAFAPSSAGDSAPLSRSATSLLLFVLWDLDQNQELLVTDPELETAIRPILRHGMELRSRIHARVNESSATPRG